MWSSRARLVVLALCAMPVLAACSGLTPVYGPEVVASQQVALNYDKPDGRLDQVIYEDLALKLGKSSGGPTLSVHTTAFSRDLSANDNALATYPAEQKQEQVSAEIKLTDVNGKILFSGMRSATADFTTNGQGLASDRAEADAALRAAHSLADTIRLTLLGVLAK